MSGCSQRFEIGGPVRRGALPALAAAINELLDVHGCATVESLASPDTCVDESTENDLRLGLDCDDPDDWVFVVEFYGSSCRHGMFQPLIDACVANDVPFDLYVERDETDGSPYVTWWRPGSDYGVNAETLGYCGAPVIVVHGAVAVQAAANYDDVVKSSYADAGRGLRLFVSQMLDRLPTPLPSYVVVDDEVKSDG